MSPIPAADLDPAGPATPSAAAAPVRLAPRGVGRFRSGHPWIYRGDLADVPAALGGGELVGVNGSRGERLGYALYS